MKSDVTYIKEPPNISVLASLTVLLESCLHSSWAATDAALAAAAVEEFKRGR